MVAFQAMNDHECAHSEFSLNACAYYVSRSPFTDFSPGVLLFLRNSHQQYKMTRSPFFSPLSLYLFLSFPLPLSFSFAYHHFCIQTRSPSSQEIVQRAVELVRTFTPSWDSRQDYMYLFILVRGVRVANTLPVNRFRIVTDNAAFSR